MRDCAIVSRLRVVQRLLRDTRPRDSKLLGCGPGSPSRSPDPRWAVFRLASACAISSGREPCCSFEQLGLQVGELSLGLLNLRAIFVVFQTHDHLSLLYAVALFDADPCDLPTTLAATSILCAPRCSRCVQIRRPAVQPTRTAALTRALLHRRWRRSACCKRMRAAPSSRNSSDAADNPAVAHFEGSAERRCVRSIRRFLSSASIDKSCGYASRSAVRISFLAARPGRKESAERSRATSRKRLPSP